VKMWMFNSGHDEISAWSVGRSLVTKRRQVIVPDAFNEIYFGITV
jgi:hypothetical protein